MVEVSLSRVRRFDQAFRECLPVEVLPQEEGSTHQTLEPHQVSPRLILRPHGRDLTVGVGVGGGTEVKKVRHLNAP